MGQGYLLHSFKLTCRVMYPVSIWCSFKFNCEVDFHNKNVDPSTFWWDFNSNLYRERCPKISLSTSIRKDCFQVKSNLLTVIFIM